MINRLLSGLGGTSKGREELEGVIWNYVSLVILSLSGMVFNLIITVFYGPSVLGVFNQGYAWYVVLSQLTVFGIHISVTRYASEYTGDREECRRLLAASIASVIIVSLLLTAVILASSEMLAPGRPEIGASIRGFAAALPFFSLNKVILGFLNGLSRMKLYAVLQSLRYIFIGVILLFMSVGGAPETVLPLSFIASEGLLFIISVFCLLVAGYVGSFPSREWIVRHLGFGLRIIPSNFTQQLNPQVDVLCLSFILKDNYAIGIYSFAILFAEGFFQVFVVLRRNLNPYITREYFEGRLQIFWDSLKARFSRLYSLFSFASYIALVAGFAILCLVIARPEYLGGTYILALVGGAIALNSRRILLGNLFSQTGKPLLESYVNLVTVGANIAMNVAMISLFGCPGAAVATSVSYFVYGILVGSFALRVPLKI